MTKPAPSIREAVTPPPPPSPLPGALVLAPLALALLAALWAAACEGAFVLPSFL